MADSTLLESFRQAAADAERPLGGRTVPRKAMLIAAAGIALLYIVGIHDKWWPSQDGAAYLILGRSIAAGEGYRSNGVLRNTFPPGLPLLLAGVYRLAGENYWIFNGVIVLCSLGRWP